MNTHVGFDFRVKEQKRRSLGVLRTPVKKLSIARILRGGRIDDSGRLPRYEILALLCLAALWIPIFAYLEFAPVRFASDVALILPGAGSTASVNLSNIGQASSSSSSPYSSSAVSPTATYKRLISSRRVLSGAAKSLGIPVNSLGVPRIKLIDQTSLIQIEMKGATPQEAQGRADAILTQFLTELNVLRADELARREQSTRGAIEGYQSAVDETRARITALQRASTLMSVEQYNGIVADTEVLAAKVRDVEANFRLRHASAVALKKTLGISAELAAITLKLHADPEFQSLAQTTSLYGAELAVAHGTFGEKHPELITVRDAYHGAKSRMYARAVSVTGLPQDQLVTKIDLTDNGERSKLMAQLVVQAAERDGLAAEYTVLSTKLKENRERVISLVDAASQLDDLNRDYQVVEAVFASALARTDTKKSDIYASYPLVQVLESASLPIDPSSPRRMIAIAAGIAGTLCLFVAMLLAWMRRPLIDRLLARNEKS